MANQVKLSARPRASVGRNAIKEVRSRGAIPAVIYGAHETPANLEVDRKAVETVLAHSASVSDLARTLKKRRSSEVSIKTILTVNACIVN